MKQFEITNFLENKFSPMLASQFDMGKIGLQFGSKNKEINKIMIALDATMDVVDEAIAKNCDLLITHHPFLFYPLLSVDYDSVLGRKLIKVFKTKLNLYSMHTNFDVASEGMNDILAKILKLTDIKIEKEVVDNNCFLRIGKTASTSLKNYVAHVAKTLNEGVIRYIGNDDKIIEKVGIVGGAGGSELMNAIKANCDCLVTGEVKHNQAIDAIENGIAVIEVSHYVESFFKEYLQQILKEAFPNCEILTSNVEKDPFKHF